MRSICTAPAKRIRARAMACFRRHRPVTDEPCDIFVYDPEVPVLAPGGAAAPERAVRPGSAGTGQQSACLHHRAAGPVRCGFSARRALSLYCATSSAHTDFTAKLVRVRPNGVRGIHLHRHRAVELAFSRDRLQRGYGASLGVLPRAHFLPVCRRRSHSPRGCEQRLSPLRPQSRQRRRPPAARRPGIGSVPLRSSSHRKTIPRPSTCPSARPPHDRCLGRVPQDRIRGRHQELRQRTARCWTRSNLRVAKGEFVTLIGPSGCGKSTVLKLISGLTMPSGGTMRVDGMTPEECARRRSPTSFRTPPCCPGARSGKTLAWVWNWTASAAPGAMEKTSRAARTGRSRARGRGLSPRAFRRHEDARLHRPRAGHQAHASADGRALCRLG